VWPSAELPQWVAAASAPGSIRSSRTFIPWSQHQKTRPRLGSLPPTTSSRGPSVSADRFRAATPLTRTAAGRFRSSAWGSPRPGRCEVSTSGQAKRSRRRLRSCPVRRILFPRSMSPRFSEAGSSPGSLEQGSNGGSVHHPRRIRRRFVALSGRAHQQPEHADRRRHQRRRNAPHPRCGQIVGRSGCR